MQQSISDVLLEFLHIVKYPNNKAKFIKEFEAFNHLETMANTLDTFSVDIQQKIKKMVKDEEKLGEIKQHLSTEAYQQEFRKVSHEALRKYIEAVSSLLTLDQKQKVVHLLKQ